MNDFPDNQQTKRVGFLGPAGTFAEEALLALDDMGHIDPVAMRTMPEVLHAVQAGELDYGFVALENSIEGTVNVTLDTLVFDTELLIQREVVLGVRLCLLAPRGVQLRHIKRVVSFPIAAAQCRDYLAREIPNAEVIASNSTAEAARQVARSSSRSTAALGTRLAATLYGLEVLADDVADHMGNQTRFVLVAREGISAPSGHDKTSVVVFQSTNRPGNLHAILGQFAARNINLTKLESRPTKQGLGDYCFVVDLEGHVDEEVVADCLRDLHVQARTVKFLGSYAAAGEPGLKRRRDAVASWRDADSWIRAIRSQVAVDPKRNRRLKVVRHTH